MLFCNAQEKPTHVYCIFFAKIHINSLCLLKKKRIPIDKFGKHFLLEVDKASGK